MLLKSALRWLWVLRPLLFLLHINDFPSNVKSYVRLFTDDCLLYRIIDTAADQHTLQQDLAALEHWGHQWGMRFNPSKCEIMIICRSPNTINTISMYTPGSVSLKVVDQAKYLGVTSTNTLSWSPHILNISGNANANISFLWRNLKHCPN